MNSSKCQYCLITLSGDKIEHFIRGGIRGCGPSRRIYFCSNYCLEKYKKEKECATCVCIGYEMEKIDDNYVCTDDSQWMNSYYPTCKEKYTGNYVCMYCNTIKNIKDEKCYGLDLNDNKDKYKTYMCESCIGPYIYLLEYDIHNNKFPWITIRENMSKIINNKYHLDHTSIKFICNVCENIMNVSELNIIDKQNMCNECAHK